MNNEPASLYPGLHILASVVLTGVGFGSAFYMYCTLRSRNVLVFKP